MSTIGATDSRPGIAQLPGLAWRLWEKFWFEAPAERQLRIFRVCLGWMLFIFYLLRSADLGFFYSEKGLVPAGLVPELLKADFRFSIFQYFPSEGAVRAFHGLFLVSLLGMTWRKTARVATWLALALHLSFLHRNPAGNYGVDLMSVFFLFYLAIGGSGRGEMGSLALRLSQMQVCIIYAYSGFHKLKNVAWWQGTAIWQVLSNRQLARWDFSWLASFPSVIVLATYATIAFEVYFAAAVWQKNTRIAWLLAGVGLHVAIGLTIQIPFFSAFMILTYVFFLQDQGLARIEKFMVSGVKKLKVR